MKAYENRFSAICKGMRFESTDKLQSAGASLEHEGVAQTQ